MIDEHLDAFLETARRHADGARLPAFVEQEFRDFLTCGEHPLTNGLSALYPGSGGRERGRPELTHGPEGRRIRERTFRRLGLYPFILSMLTTTMLRDEVNAGAGA